MQNQTAADDNHRANALLRKCVHCGFCNSVCPTYAELADEQNGPRGRIWQMKSFLAGEHSADVNLANLDLCLTCGACQSACPSGVEYLAAYDIVKPLMEKQLHRGFGRRILRRIALAVLPYHKRARPFVRLAQMVGMLKLHAPMITKPAAKNGEKNENGEKDKNKENKTNITSALLFDGCIQSTAAAGINHHAAKLLAAVGIDSFEEKDFCCGALQMHLGDEEKGKARIRNNTDILHRRLQSGAKWIVSTASGCGRMLASYGRVLADEQSYAIKAKQVSAAVVDIGALLAMQNIDNLQADTKKINDKGEAVFHCPCTLAHGDGAGGGAAAVMKVLTKAGVRITMPPPVCCGSAGFYSYENPKMAQTLRDKRLMVLQNDKPAAILTANIGCQMHLQSGTKTPVRHWLDLLQVRG